MKLSLFWKLMLAFTLVVAIGLGAVVILANQVTTSEFHQMMMGGDAQGMMGPNGMMGRGQEVMQQAALERVNRAILIGGLLALVAAVIVGFFVFRAITRPIEQLTRAAHRLAQGDLSARVGVDDHPSRLGSDEISELGAAFNTMASTLQQSEQVRRDMTADIAHELRTPLAVMRGNLEALLDGVYPFDADHLTPVLNQVNLLTRLVEDLRTLALAEAGQLLDRTGDGAKNEKTNDHGGGQGEQAADQYGAIHALQRRLLQHRLPAPHHAAWPHHHARDITAHHHLVKFAGCDLIGQDHHRAQADGDDQREGEHQLPEQTQFHKWS